MIILCVDDDAEDMDVFFEAIRETFPSATLFAARSGEDAITLLKKLSELPDYIFLDINMPLMGGIECLTAIKADRKLRKLDIVVYSTTKNEKEIATVIRMGAQFLVKQPDYNKLVLDLAAILSAKAMT
jgi:CheY-like chemotaxis protein